MMCVIFPAQTFGGGTDAVNGPNAPRKDRLLLATVLSVIKNMTFPVFFAAMFDATFRAAMWMRAARLALQRFKNDVRGVAYTALDPEMQQNADDRPGAKVYRSFDRARNMVETTNAIFAVPLSCFSVCLLLGGVGMTGYSYFVQDNDASLPFLFVMPVFLVSLLVFVATVGDEFLSARANLLYPDVAGGLLRAIGESEQKAFANALNTTQLGIKIVQVTITSQKVLYVVFSMVLFAVYIIPK